MYVSYFCNTVHSNAKQTFKTLMKNIIFSANLTSTMFFRINGKKFYYDTICHAWVWTLLGNNTCTKLYLTKKQVFQYYWYHNMKFYCFIVICVIWGNSHLLVVWDEAGMNISFQLKTIQEKKPSKPYR